MVNKKINITNSIKNILALLYSLIFVNKYKIIKSNNYNNVLMGL